MSYEYDQELARCAARELSDTPVNPVNVKASFPAVAIVVAVMLAALLFFVLA
ncbi:hypothetical protein MACH17_24150 [Phaeobacter inhibens]|uniref:hypothetical protein n=1 Tax=Phaeobacter inhibens TaxID=221822 RepID=UPI002752E725|nr:hypothetical protein [Phaeobacter inhibens]GLO70898.1 hypothetical protein MACH17_24150 [Phaeobacter inhibens]